jgi:hypothetical protein
MRRIATVLAVGLLVFMHLVPTAGAETIAQPSELERVPVTVLEPPGRAGSAELTVVVPRGEFSFYWLELQRLVTSQGGSVLRATADTVQQDGLPVTYGVAEVEVPSSSVGVVIGEIIGFGSLVDGTIESSSGSAASWPIAITLSDSTAVPIGAGGLEDESTLGRALDTAKDVMLTIFSVVIVVASAVIPIGLMAGLGYLLYRWARNAFDGSAPPAEQERQPELIDS